MGGKKKYVEMFGSFTEPFICKFSTHYTVYSSSCTAFHIVHFYHFVHCVTNCDFHRDNKRCIIIIADIITSYFQFLFRRPSFQEITPWVGLPKYLQNRAFRDC